MSDGSFQPEHTSRELITSLPMVIARPLQRLMAAGSSTDLNDAAKMTLNYTLRFLGQVCISDYLAADDWYDPIVTGLVQDRVKRNSMGHWVEITRAIISSAAARRRTMFLQELPDTWQRTEFAQPLRLSGVSCDEDGPVAPQRRFGRLEYLLKHRNDLEHGRIMSTDEAKAEEFRLRTVEALAEYAWLGRYEVLLQDPSGWWRCRGLHPMLISTSDPGKRPELHLRLPDPGSAAGARSLRLLPLVVPRSLVSADAAGGETDIAVYGQMVGERQAQYTGPSLDTRTRRVGEFGSALATTIEELHALLRRKEFPLLGREGLTAEQIRERIRAATDLTFRTLHDSRKYTPELHVPRESCEDRLADWLRSPLPLLGVHGEPGSGKTGILASLVRRWNGTEGGPAVLFLLAAKFADAGSLDALVEQALRLHDVSLERLASHEQLNGLVVVLDGLNEHPARERLLSDILQQAHRSRERGVGARFLISWRTDDRAWIEPALAERALWWDPGAQRVASVRTTGSRDDWGTQLAALRERLRPAGSDTRETPRTSVATDGQAQAAPNRSGSGPTGPAPELDRGTAGETPAGSHANDRAAAHPALRVPALDDAEAARIWERYREREPHRLNPGFSLEDLGRSSRWAHRALASPLGIRIALETFHEREVPSSDEAESLFFSFLSHLERGSTGPAVRRLLDTVSRLVLASRRNRVELREIEAAGGSDLLFATPESAMDRLVRRGVLSMLRSPDGRDACAFTVERVAEHALGRVLSEADEASDPSWLANRAVQLQDLTLSKGAVEAALHLLSDRHGIDYVFRFVDAVPSEHAGIAGRALGAHLLRSGPDGAADVAEGLLSQRTDSDFEVARAAADYLWWSEGADAAVELAFLDAVAEPALEAFLSGNETAGEVLRQYAQCLIQHHHASSEDDAPAGEASGSIEWLEDVLRRAEGVAPLGPVLALMHELGRHLLRDDRDADAAACFGRVVERLAGADRSDPALQRQFLLALHQQARALERCERFAEALAAYRRGPLEASRHPHQPGWTSDDDDAGEARCLEGLGRWEEALPLRERLLHAAEASGDRRDIAIALEFVARAQRNSGLVEEAIECFERSLRTGLEPTRCENWYPAVLANALARAEGARGNHDAAVGWRRRCLAFVQADLESGLAERRNVAIELELLGDALREAGRLDEAVAQYHASLDMGMNPEWCDRWSPVLATIELARCHVSAGRHDRAEAEMEQLVQRTREHGEALHLARALLAQASILQQLDRHEDAIVCLEAAVTEGDERAVSAGWSPTEALESLVESREALGDLEGARADVRRILELVEAGGDRRAKAIALEREARLLRALGRHAEALDAAGRSLDAGLLPEPCRDWSPYPAAEMMVESLEAMDRRPEALEAAREMVRRVEPCSRRSRAIVLELLGDTLERADRPEEAIRAFLQSTEVGMTPAPVARWSLATAPRKAARLLLRLDRVDEAMTLLKESQLRSLRHSDRAASANDLELDADMLREEERLREAAEIYGRSIQVGMQPRQAPGWSPRGSLWGLADALARLGDHKGSLDAAERYLAAARMDQDRRAEVIGLEIRAYAHLGLGQLDAAERDARASIAAATQGKWVGEWSPIPSGQTVAKALAGLGRAAEVPAFWHSIAQLCDHESVRRARAIALELQGDALKDAGHPEEAIKAFRAALESGMHPHRCSNWNPLVLLHKKFRCRQALAQWPQALEGADAYLAMARRVENSFGLAVGHELRCLALLELGRHFEALEAARKALDAGMGPPWVRGWRVTAVTPLVAAALRGQDRASDVAPTLHQIAERAGSLGHAQAKATVLVQAGEAFAKDGDESSAVEVLQEAVTLAETHEDQALLVRAVAALRQPLMRLGRHAEALGHVTRMLERARVAGQTPTVAEALCLRAELLNELGQHQEALRDAGEAIDRGCEGPWSEDWSPLAAADATERAMVALQRTREVPTFWSSIAARATHGGRRLEQAEALLRSGMASADADDHAAAIPSLERALGVAGGPEPLQDWDHAHALATLASCHAALGHHAEALELERRCEQAVLADGNLSNAVRCCIRQVTCLTSVGDLAGAEVASARCVSHAQRSGERRLLALAHLRRGEFLRDRERHADAIDHFGQAIDAARQPEPIPDWPLATAIMGLSTSLAATGDLPQALDLLQPVIDAALDAQDHAEAAQLLEHRGQLLGEADRLEEAAIALASMARHHSLAKDADGRAKGLLLHASCLERLGRSEEAGRVLAAMLDPGPDGIETEDAVAAACSCCPALAEAQPELAGRLARPALRQVFALARSRGDAVMAALDLAILLPSLGPTLVTEPVILATDALLRHLLQALQTLERANLKGRHPEMLRDGSVRAMVAQAWDFASTLLDATGDPRSAAGARESAELWRKAP